MFKLQAPSKYSPCDSIHLLRHFFHCSKQFLNSLILMPFSASAIFGFASSTLARHFPLCTFFTQGNNQKKKFYWGQIGWIRRMGQEGHAVFGQKLLNNQCGIGRYTCKSAMMKWANALKESSKNSLKPNAASSNNASWHTDTDGFLKHSPSSEACTTRGLPSRR